MIEKIESHPAIDAFIARARITEVLFPLKSGKEATVYACRAHPSSGARFLAAKVYRDAHHRSFRKDAVYFEGDWRFARGGRAVRAFQNRSDFGRQVQAGVWVSREWETLRALHEAGIAVPRPVDTDEGGILMELLAEPGSEDSGEVRPAPPLALARLTPEEAVEAYLLLKDDVGRMLARNIVHGDLSPYNVLCAPPLLRIIDFPQAVDPRTNPSARALLGHDLASLHRHLAKIAGASVLGDPAAQVEELWRRWIEGS